MHDNPDRIPLALVPRELAYLTDGQPPTYRRVYKAVLDYAVPAEQENGRWNISRADLPLFAEHFGMTTAA